MLPGNRHNLEKKEKDLDNGKELWSINKHHDLCSIRENGAIISTWDPGRYQTRSEWIKELKMK